MKKILILITVISISMASCAKKRTCTDTKTKKDGSVDVNVKMYDELTPGEKTQLERFGTYTESDGTRHSVVCD